MEVEVEREGGILTTGGEVPGGMVPGRGRYGWEEGGCPVVRCLENDVPQVVVGR